MILTDPDLRQNWESELENMRKGMLDLRKLLSTELKRKTKSDRFNFIAEHRGMFSRLGLTEDNVKILRERFGIYMVSDSRINIAGLHAENIDFLASSISEII